MLHSLAFLDSKMKLTYKLATAIACAAIVTVQPSLTTAQSYPVAQRLEVTELSALAKNATVRIDGPETGSGVIIGQRDNTYMVLTNWHVVDGAGQYQVGTYDGQQYAVKEQRQIPGVDLAVVMFATPNEYFIAPVGDSEPLVEGQRILFAGYPDVQPGESDRWYRFYSNESLVSLPPADTDGYALVYSGPVFTGMSGSPIFNEKGQLIGIHGRARTDFNTSQASLYGIPINTAKALLQNVGLALNSTLNSGSTPNTRPSSSFVLAKLLDLRSAHSDEVESLAFRPPNGEIIASASDSGTIKLWNVNDGTQIRELQGHRDEVNTIAFSPNGQLIASGSHDKTVKVWDVNTGNTLSTLKGHSSKVQGVTFSPDGQRIASGSRDKTVRIWDVNTGNTLQTLTGHNGRVDGVAFSPNGDRLASGSDGVVKVWDLSTGREIYTFNGHTDLVRSVAFSPNGEFLASTGYDGVIKIWNLRNGTEARSLDGHNRQRIDTLAFSPDGKYLASGSYDKTVKIWNWETGSVIDTLKGHYDHIGGVAFSPNGEYLASGSADRTIQVWRVPR